MTTTQAVTDLAHVVPQRTDFDCVVAALATVRGWPYERARAVLGDHTHDRGTYLMPMVRALLSEGIAATWLVSREHPMLGEEHQRLHRIRMLATPDELRRLLPGRKAITVMRGLGPNDEVGPEWGHALAWDGQNLINCGANGTLHRAPAIVPLETADLWEVLLLTDLAQQPVPPFEVPPIVTNCYTGLDALAALFDRHERVFLGFSGGKESITLAHMLEPWRDRVTLLWVNTGFMASHMVDFVHSYGERYTLHEIASPSLTDQWQAFGAPVDVAPVANLVGAAEPRFSTLEQCCFALRQRPLNAFLQDQSGSVCLINGQRRDDFRGATQAGLRQNMPPTVEIVMPLAGWSEADVYAYVERHGLELPPQYAEGYRDSIECIVCPANPWPPRLAYLRKHYPEVIPVIRGAVKAAAAEAVKVASQDLLTVMDGVEDTPAMSLQMQDGFAVSER